MNRHEVHVFANGKASIKSLEAGETMHSEVGPDEEAQSVYIEQSGLADRLNATASTEPLVLYDVGMGIASNALAAIDLARSLSPCRPLKIVSFENSLEGLQLALQDPHHFPTQARFKDEIDSIVSQQSWQNPDGLVNWTLVLGNFETAKLEQAPEVVFYDFYSPKSSPTLWSVSNFQRLFDAMEKRRAAHQECILTTYSAATFVRAGLLLAGFHVGYGRSTALKAETTVASTKLSALAKPLGQEWLQKLSRSSKPFPQDAPEAAISLEKILANSQFGGAK